MTRATKTGPMCIVSIDHLCELLMPAEKGMKLVALLQDSVRVDQDYQVLSRRTYITRDVPEVQYNAVKPDQIVMPQASTSAQRRKGPLLLERD